MYDNRIEIVCPTHSKWDSDPDGELHQPSENFLERTDTAMGMLKLSQTAREIMTHF